MGMGRLGSMLRRRTQNPTGAGQRQGQGIGAGMLATTGIGEVRAGGAGWNDVPPNTREELGRYQRADVLAAVQRSDGNIDDALRDLRSTHRIPPET